MYKLFIHVFFGSMPCRRFVFLRLAVISYPRFFCCMSFASRTNFSLYVAVLFFCSIFLCGRLDIATAMHTPVTSSSATLQWLPGGLVFRPLFANPFEARMGVMSQTAPQKLRLDIGNSTDLLQLMYRDWLFTFGGDFYTYSRLRAEPNFKFPVETADYLFGINLTAQTQLSEASTLSSRLRISHISSHLVDGIADFRSTFVYSREFIDWVWAYQYKPFRVYGGATIIFNMIPKVFGTFVPQAGFDIADNSLLDEHITLKAGYDFRLTTINDIATGINTAQVGVKFGNKHGKGVTLSTFWYEGKSMHGMFYNERDSYFGMGMIVEF
jgi:hypothetical protein